MNIKEKLKNIFAPANLSCVYCGKEIPKTDIPVCSECKIKEDALIRHSFHGSVMFTAEYEGVIRELILECKFRCHPSFSEYIAYLMQKTLKVNGVDADIITYIPMHENKRKQRGYDHAFLIAKHLSKLSGIPLKTLVKRTKQTESLYTLSAENRRKEMKGVFSFESDINIAGKKILLIDDIITTGASMAEASRILSGKKAQVINFAFSKRDN